MKRRAQVMMTLDHHYIPELHADGGSLICTRDDGTVLGALGLFMKMLGDLSADHPGMSVSVLGHSTGAIVACNLLHESRERKVRWKDIVFMAAACTIEDFDTKVRPGLETGTWRWTNGPEVYPRFYNLCLHPTAEFQEFSYPFAFFIRGSLLVWIDDFLADPGSFRDRTLGRAANAMPYMGTLPDAVLEHSYLRVFDYPRKKGDGLPRKHSDFLRSGNGFWKRDYWMPVRQDSIPRVAPLPIAQDLEKKEAKLMKEVGPSKN